MIQVKKDRILDMILNSDTRSLGAIATKVVEALNMQSDSNEIKGIILKDAALTAQIIKIANTSKTERDTQRKCLHEAIVRIGYDGLRSICICIGIVENIPLRHSTQRTMILDCLHRCFETATHADNLVKKLSNDDRKGAYIAGLLCNIGELTFLSSPIVNMRDYVELHDEGLTPEQACLSLCGFDYDELSEQIVEKWELSSLINEAFSEAPATNSGKAIKVAFELTRAYHNGRNSKAFIEVSKRLMREFDLGFKESVVFIEKGIEHAKVEFNQYWPILKEPTETNEHSPIKPHGIDANHLTSKKQNNRRIDSQGKKNEINRLIGLAKTNSSPKIYFSALSDAICNHISFERVVISEVISNKELKAVSASGTDTQGLKKGFSFGFNFGESVISEIIETKKPLYFSKNSDPEGYDLVDDHIKEITGIGRTFYLCPILKKGVVIAIAYMDMGTRKLLITKEQIEATNRLVGGVSSALSMNRGNIKPTYNEVSIANIN